MGVEHLLRDIKDTTVGTLSQRITNQLLGLKGLHSQIKDIRDYLVQVCFLLFFVLSLYHMANRQIYLSLNQALL